MRWLALLVVAVAAAASVALADEFSIVKQNCQSITAAPIADVPYSKEMPIMETCSLCDTIVKNAQRFPSWEYVDDIGFLCQGVPEHVLEMCEYYACKLSQCAAFQQMSCSSTDQNGEIAYIHPCTSQYICWDCLKVPSRQVRGCFDSLTEEPIW